MQNSDIWTHFRTAKDSWIERSYFQSWNDLGGCSTSRCSKSERFFYRTMWISPRFLCRLTALIMLLLPFNDRACYIRKPSNLPHRSYDRHISTFRGYRFLFSIRNPYINRFTNYFSIHSKPSYPQKVVLHSITARFCLRSYYSAIWLPFSNLQTWSRDTNWMITVTHCMMGAT